MTTINKQFERRGKQTDMKDLRKLAKDYGLKLCYADNLLTLKLILELREKPKPLMETIIYYLLHMDELPERTQQIIYLTMTVVGTAILIGMKAIGII